MQEIKPVKRVRTPRYPSREAALAQPELLKLLPKRWRQCKQAAAAAGLMATMAITSTGCSLIAPTPMYAGAPTMSPLITEADAFKSIRNATSKVLPALVNTVDISKLGKPVEYVMKNDTGSGYRIVSLKKSTVDLFDISDGIGFEYLGTWDEVAMLDSEQTEQTASKPDNAMVHVLVINQQNASDQNEAEEKLRIQVEGFLSWLKAEGIG